MSFEQIILHGGLLIILLIAAVQDIQKREVSNWITIPLFVAGITGILVARDLVLVCIALSFVVIAMLPGGYGAADAKILVSLAGLWPQAVPFSLLVMLALDLYWRKYKQGGLAPLVVAIVMGVLFTITSKIIAEL